jgi:putative peptidoglycan lipid II flippase
MKGRNMPLARAVLTLSGLTLVSRMLGFIRDVASANLLGAGPVADAFIIAFRLPNFFRRIFAEGAFSIAFVPIFVGIRQQQGEGEARLFAGRALGVLAILLLPLTGLALWRMEEVVRVVAPGLGPYDPRYELAVELSRITFPYLALISLTALQGAVLNALGRHGPFAFAPILFNLCLLVGLALAPFFPTVGHALAWGEVAAGVVQVLWMAWACQQAGMALPLVRLSFGKDIRRLFFLMGPTALGAGATQLNILIDQQIASLLPGGAIAYLYYAERLYQLPLGVIGVAVGTALLPILSAQIKAGDEPGARQSLAQSIELSLLLAAPAAVALMVGAKAILSTLFAYGAFSLQDAAASAKALTAYAAGIPAFVLAKVLASAYFAREDMKTPVVFALISVAVNTCLAVILALFLDFGHAGIALATSLAGWLNVWQLGLRLHKRGLLVNGWALVGRLMRLGVALVGLAIWTACLEWGLASWWQGSFGWRVGWLALFLPFGGVIYGGLVVLLRL